MRGIPQEHI